MKIKENDRQKPWFTYIRRSYLPASWQGLIVYLIYVVYVVALPMAWYKRGHHWWPLLTAVIPLLTASAVLTQYIASKNSR